ncbi:acyl-CoA N-acyltransferase [Basidiobolus meristosporus CBS 931.73]|uniref:Glucosamine 6-phosphate N-acetyltransferase n=1 Tax=Basidiobolus meristosporus CBS 931.73 TaxID=1314790 RepID=A0A1Y1YSP7_9FUNG|nr:acyl-CoA N-acyltransferase [Basidiobolus meristosporus CBS 931.73]|eukprot:ORY00777.1 acyl-CoA N-acyltransferase [Basidiobolus meristosporus CBS 931.73]
MASPLFSPKLISQEIQSKLPEGFVIRPLQIDDYEKGFLETLSQLTVVGDYGKDKFIERYEYMKKHNHEYFTIVIENTKEKRIFAAGTVLIERKFIRGAGLVGHIEDIVVHKGARGLNFGKWIILQLKHIGASVGCYKIILDCSKDNIPFYEKCGFDHKEYEMVWYCKDAVKAKL